MMSDTTTVIPHSRFLQGSVAYTIDSWSSHTSSYHPKNILVDHPTDQASRWSSGSRDQDQYLLLKLDKPVILQAITFGKYHMRKLFGCHHSPVCHPQHSLATWLLLAHVCNLKEFKVLSSMDKTHYIEILHSGLRNDTEPETFPVKFKTHNVCFPTLFVKIVPLMAWGASFNYGIWYVDLRALCDPKYVEAAISQFVKYRESEAIRLCLKFFRDSIELSDVYESLFARTGIQLEDSLICRLHDLIMCAASLDQVEALLDEAHRLGYYEEHVRKIPYRSEWKRIQPIASPVDGVTKVPCPRGGHQVVIDERKAQLYLFGGWDGKQDLGDLWIYDITALSWQLVSENVATQGGPSPRSVHKMVFHKKLGRIYTLGRFIDPASVSASSMSTAPSVASAAFSSSPSSAADFYCYELDSQRWTCLSQDTKSEGGPDLIYDHQMAIDEAKNTIYVFGGKSIRSTSSEPIFSGLFSYAIDSGLWACIRSDTKQPLNTTRLRSRIGHSMLFNPVDRQLYIFSGQRYRDLLNDFYVYDVDHDTVTNVILDMQVPFGGPSASFTQRASIDTGAREIIVLGGQYYEPLPLEADEKAPYGDFALPTDDASSDPCVAQAIQRNEIWVLSYHQEWDSEARRSDSPRLDLAHSSPERKPWSPHARSLHGRYIDEDFTQWQQVARRTPMPADGRAGMPTPLEPSLRYAHQFVYDATRKVHYLFGGNVGDFYNSASSASSSDLKDSSSAAGDRAQIRLNDQWELKLTRPSSDCLLKRAKFFVRRQKYFELIHSGEKPSAILKYLQTQIKQVVDPENDAECEEFRSLPGYLFKGSAGSTADPSDPASSLSFATECRSIEASAASSPAMATTRRSLFESLLEFFPKSMKQPKANITDFVI